MELFISLSKFLIHVQLFLARRLSKVLRIGRLSLCCELVLAEPILTKTLPQASNLLVV